jgi:hypothetical protein
MRIPKLPIGQANVCIKKIRTAKAQGCKMLKGWKAMKSAQIETAFNTPVLCIKVRRAA